MSKSATLETNAPVVTAPVVETVTPVESTPETTAETVTAKRAPQRPRYEALVASDGPVAILRGMALVPYPLGGTAGIGFPVASFPTDMMAQIAFMGELTSRGMELTPIDAADVTGKGYLVRYHGKDAIKTGGTEAVNMTPDDYLADAKDDLATLTQALTLPDIGTALALCKGKLDAFIRDYRTVANKCAETNTPITIQAINTEIDRPKRVKGKTAEEPAA